MPTGDGSLLCRVCDSCFQCLNLGIDPSHAQRPRSASPAVPMDSNDGLPIEAPLYGHGAQATSPAQSPTTSGSAPDSFQAASRLESSEQAMPALTHSLSAEGSPTDSGPISAGAIHYHNPDVESTVAPTLPNDRTRSSTSSVAIPVAQSKPQFGRDDRPTGTHAPGSQTDTESIAPESCAARSWAWSTF